MVYGTILVAHLTKGKETHLVELFHCVTTLNRKLGIVTYLDPKRSGINLYVICGLEISLQRISGWCLVNQSQTLTSTLVSSPFRVKIVAPTFFTRSLMSLGLFPLCLGRSISTFIPFTKCLSFWKSGSRSCVSCRWFLMFKKSMHMLINWSRGTLQFRMSNNVFTHSLTYLHYSGCYINIDNDAIEAGPDTPTVANTSSVKVWQLYQQTYWK